MSDKRQPEDTSRKHPIVSAVGAVFAVLLSAGGVFGLYHGLNWFVHSKIEESIHSPETLQELVRQLRPWAVFNGDGSILYDGGADQFVDIKIAYESKDGTPYLMTITITPKAFMKNPPLIRGIDSPFVCAMPSREPPRSWVFQVSSLRFEYGTKGEASGSLLKKSDHYLIELLP